MAGAGIDYRKRRLAMVVNTLVEFGIARQFHLHADSRAPANIRVFRTIEEACAWLDRPVAGVIAELEATDGWVATVGAPPGAASRDGGPMPQVGAGGSESKPGTSTE